MMVSGIDLKASSFFESDFQGFEKSVNDFISIKQTTELSFIEKSAFPAIIAKIYTRINFLENQ